MKNTLELKDLAGYLPYGLKVINEPNGFEVFLKGIQIDGDIIHCLGKSPIKFIKPILYSLSSLTKEIEVNGEKFVPIIELARLGTGIDNFDVVNHVFVDEKREQLEITNKKGIKCLFAFDPKDNSFCLIHAGQTVTANNQLAMFQKLYEWHFAIDIPENLYIDKNTI